MNKDRKEVRVSIIFLITTLLRLFFLFRFSIASVRRLKEEVEDMDWDEAENELEEDPDWSKISAARSALEHVQNTAEGVGKHLQEATASVSESVKQMGGEVANVVKKSGIEVKQIQRHGTNLIGSFILEYGGNNEPEKGDQGEAQNAQIESRESFMYQSWMNIRQEEVDSWSFATSDGYSMMKSDDTSETDRQNHSGTNPENSLLPEKNENGANGSARPKESSKNKHDDDDHGVKDENAQLQRNAVEEGSDVDLYPPGRLLLLHCSPPGCGSRPTTHTDGPKEREYGTFPSFKEFQRSQWNMFDVDQEHVGPIIVSPWCVSDHMLSTVCQGINRLQAM
eukprot:TRINITY_DN2544_c0_g1_i4.p1 TRINITY_DN2544_c0_g1~~TRINITY_DN2544_c0_g1_i4.p1  ORF type:complete len:338 (+),score=64.40 TRINITY_DN2544_c0_g1_i4:156-1169(+)